MPDVFEVLGAAHREVEQMLDRMQYLIGGAAEPTPELREQGGSLAGTLISAVSQHEAAEEEYFWPAVKEKVAGRDSLAAGGHRAGNRRQEGARRAGRHGPRQPAVHSADGPVQSHRPRSHRLRGAAGMARPPGRAVAI